MNELLMLFGIFFKVGLFTFGGGYAMLPILDRELVEKKKWLETEELLDYYAIGQCTPGIIAVNTATFVGYRRKGILGGIVATLGVVIPSLIMITVIAALLSNYAEIDTIRHAFAGIRVAVAALVITTIVSMFKKSVVDWLCLIIFALSFALSVFAGISPVFVILAAAFLGLLFGTRMKNMKEDAKDDPS
jgi:chromate transporter